MNVIFEFLSYVILIKTNFERGHGDIKFTVHIKGGGQDKVVGDKGYCIQTKHSVYSYLYFNKAPFYGPDYKDFLNVLNLQRNII